MKQISIDLETFCVTDIKSAGAHKYAEKAEILLFAYKVDDEPIQLIDFTEFWGLGIDRKDYLPKDIWEGLFDPTVLKTAWNCGFERSEIHAFFGVYCPPEQWKDTMVTAAMCGLPLALGEAAKALNMEQQKDNIGKTLIRFFSIPCKPTKANGMRERNLPEHAPEKWEQFKSYCIQDVLVETQIAKKLDWYKIPEVERQLWFLDQKKNERGMKVDMVLIDQAIKMDKIFRDRMIAEAGAITGLSNVNSVAQLKGWLEEETGEDVESLAKNNVAKMLTEVDSAKAKRVLEIRALMAKSSIKKYQAMKNAAGRGDRIRGMIQYYGAQRTGREAGRLAQPQNFPRISDEFEEFLDISRELVKAGDLETIELIFGDAVPNILSQLLRTTFIADKGKEFIVLDFSSIEMVVLSWVANEEWRLKVFAEGGDIYKESASVMFKKPKAEITKDERQKGKISELLCIEENQLVLTHLGTVPIKDVTLLHKVWDGENFVTHDGAIFKGIKEVITYEGLTATKDHIVWSTENEQLQFGELAARGSHLLQSGNSGQAIRVGENNQPREKMVKKLEKTNGTRSVYRMPKNKVVRSLHPNSGCCQRVQCLHTIRNAGMATGKVSSGSKTLQQSEICSIPQLRRSRDKIQFSVCTRGRTLDNTKLRSTGQRIGTGQDRQQFTLSSRKYSFRNSGRESIKSSSDRSSLLGGRRLALCSISSNKKAIFWNDQRTNISRCGISRFSETKKLAFYPRKARVYDIINCGPNNRFTVSNALVHNCQFGGTEPAMEKLMETIADPKKRIPKKEMKPLIKAWRTANPNIVQTWWDTGNAAIDTVKTGLPNQVLKGIYFEMRNKNLMMVLPSGRSLCYPGAHIRKYWIGTVKVKVEGEFIADENLILKPVYELKKIKLGEVVSGTMQEFHTMMRMKGVVQAENVEPSKRDSLCFWGPNSITKKWEIMETHGARLCENFTQAIARDFLMHSILNFENRGIECTLSVHDEGIFEALKGLISFEKAKEIFLIKPKWGQTMPLNADGFIGDYYKK